MEAPHERAAGYLTMTWTPTDQVIMEHLLLEEEQHAPSPPLSSSSSPSSPELWKSSDAAANSADNDSCSAGSGSESTSKATTAAAKKGDEERRARHRAVQRRFVQRKKEAFRRTKQFAQELEAKYRFLRIAAEERDLRHERVMLEAQSVSIAPPNTDAIAVSNPVDELIEKQLELVREFFVPLSMEELSAVQRSNQYEYDISLSTGRDEMYQTTGLTIMGWNDHRKIDDASVKLALSKEFPNVRALDLMDRTWRCLSSPETYGSFFSPILNIKMQLLQVIDRDTVVIHRVLYHPQTQRTSNSLELLWRVRLGGEYVIFDASLQNNAAQKCLGESYNWTQMTTSMSFVPTPSDGCLFRHGGWLRRFAISTLKYWLIEMFFMALRFESSMVAPVFALPPDTGSASASPEPASDVQSDDAQSDDAASPSLLAA